MKKILLHICCGVCALHCIEYLKAQKFYVEGFFFNPNIQPQEEYQKRKEYVDRLTDLYQIKIITAPYEPKIWHDICDIYKDEKEGGNRCYLCYSLRLFKTYEVMLKNNFDYFTTTLTISPHKKSNTIFEIANKIDKDKFLAIDFKKQDGFKKTTYKASQFNFYRQNYCGCIYSIKNK
ncbi:MAG: epoxyqueuosine reductase QueH [Candidatus Omnitrophica bacterium]|nr:epoxyqueuosine reductase QueH [Candidatus Omnitrophota bacterium]